MDKIKRAAHRLDSYPILRKRNPPQTNSLPPLQIPLHNLQQADEMSITVESPNPISATERSSLKPDDTQEGNNTGLSPNSQLSDSPPRQLTFKSCAKSILFASKVNVLLPFVLFGIISKFVGWSPTVVFILNFLAIVPLAKLLGFATEDIALRVGETLGGLLNATFGNAVELIVSIIALSQGLIRVVQASMLGSILSNMLLVLGMCFLFGGYYYKEQEFNQTAAQTSASLLAMSVLSLLLPAAFRLSNANNTSEVIQNDIIYISHITAVILLLIYIGYLFFQLKTHASFYEQTAALQEEEESDEPQLPTWGAVLMLLVVTVLVGVCSEFLVGAIESVTKEWGITETFVGLILLPIVGNAAEHVTAITVALKNKVDLAIGVAVGSATQIALLVTPLMVVVGWIIGQPMTLFFDTFETAVILVSVLIVNYIISDGKSNWLEGLLLLGTYIIVAVSVWYLPDVPKV